MVCDCGCNARQCFLFLLHVWVLFVRTGVWVGRRGTHEHLCVCLIGSVSCRLSSSIVVSVKLGAPFKSTVLSVWHIEGPDLSGFERGCLWQCIWKYRLQEFQKGEHKVSDV